MPNIVKYGGYDAPNGITSTAEIKKLQKTLGVPVDGVWGPISQKAYSDYLGKFNEPMTAQYQVEGYSAPGMVRHQQDVRRMQDLLGVSVDGIWGPETDKAYKQRIAQESGAAVPVRDNADQSSAIAESRRRIAARAAAVPSIDSAAARSYTGGITTPQNRKTLSLMMQEDARAGSAPATPLSRDIEEVRPDTDEYDKRKHLPQEGIEAGGNKRLAVEDQKKKERQEQEKRELRRQDSAKTGYTPFTLYSNMDYALGGASSVLNRTTALENKESCCNLYSVVIDGKTRYFTGEVFVGKLYNVIDPYLTDALTEKQILSMDGLVESKPVQYEGLIHAHPYTDWPEAFSGDLGDTAVATLSGNIYLTTADGNIYKLSRPDDLFKDVLSSAGPLSHSGLTGAQTDVANTEHYLNALQTLKSWYADPPLEPYKEGLHSAITTHMYSLPNSNYLDEVSETVKELAPEFILNAAIKRLFGMDGFYLYQKNKEEFSTFVREFGKDAVEILSQLNLYS